ncbi:hypothetical protein D3C87_1777720 [compost metagenome]
MGELDIGCIDAIEFAKSYGAAFKSKDMERGRRSAQKGIELAGRHAQPLIPAQRFADGAIEWEKLLCCQPLKRKRGALDWRPQRLTRRSNAHFHVGDKQLNHDLLHRYALRRATSI